MDKPIFTAAAAALALFASPAAAQPDFRQSAMDAEKGLPFSQSVRVGEVVYLSGQIGNRPGTLELVPGGMAAETRQAMENIRTALAARGLGFDDVFKCTVMLADMSKWGEFNGVYRTYFKPGRYPARSSFGANSLAMGAQVELECWAYARTGR
ncbi:MAG TPA: RidA family protein [Caulobacteraceae bacterium]|jgi:reactive intermediate/imine deaminase